jgi:hypothetical protein
MRLPDPTTPGLTTPWRQLVLTLSVLDSQPLPALDDLAWTTDKADRAWPHVAGGTLMAVRGPRETPSDRQVLEQAASAGWYQALLYCCFQLSNELARGAPVPAKASPQTWLDKVRNRARGRV